MARIDCKVSVKELMTTAVPMIPGRRAGLASRVQIAYVDRPGMGFTVQADVPSDCRRMATKNAKKRYGHTHQILSCRILTKDGSGVQVILAQKPTSLADR